MSGWWVWRLVGLAVGRSGGWSVGEILCFELLPQFSSDLNETCYTWSLWGINVYYIDCVRPMQGSRVMSLFSELFYICLSLFPVTRRGKGVYSSQSVIAPVYIGISKFGTAGYTHFRRFSEKGEVCFLGFHCLKKSDYCLFSVKCKR